MEIGKTSDKAKLQFTLVLILIMSLLAAVCCTYSFAEIPLKVTDEVIQSITSCGFENVRVMASSNTLIIEYENKVYLREKDAIKVIVSKTMNVAPDIEKLVLIPKRDNIPLFQIVLTNPKITEFDNELIVMDPNVSHNLTGYESTVKKYNSSVGKIDINIHPSAGIVLGHYDDPFISQFFISPDFSVFWGKGIRSNVQLRFKLRDDLENKSRRVDLYKLCLSYTYRHSALIFMNVGVGLLEGDRYGIASEALLYKWKNRIGIGGTIAWLGNTDYQDGKLYYTRLWKKIGLINLYYKLPFWDTLVTARFGRFLYEDQGGLIEVTRFFHNTSLTAFVSKTDYGSTAGFQLQLLTYPRRNLKPSYVRVKLPEVLDMEYRYNETGVATVFSPEYYTDYITDTLWLMNLK
ncbi:MAG: YjbH domain-containing protein [Chloroflexi bacterium]|nr:YjbH domain-containing protein [Chloroflexota bacterium]